MRKVEFSAQAKDDLKSIARYLAAETRSRAFGAKFTRKLRERCSQLAGRTQLMGGRREDLAEGLRSVTEGSYMIFFRYRGPIFEVILIIERHREMEAQFAPATK